MLNAPYKDGVISNQHIKYKKYLIACTSDWKFVDHLSEGSQTIKILQKKIGVKDDGIVGQNTIKALQKYVGTPVDGRLDKHSLCVKELQRRLNKGKF